MSARNCSMESILKSKLFDYDSYLGQCTIDECVPETINNYAQIAGVVYMSSLLYPDKTPEEAYRELSVFANNPINVSTGLGDTIAKITSAVGITPCGGCKERQETLNRWFPYEH